MDYNQILMLLLQFLIIAGLLAGLFRIRNIFGLSLLYTTLGVFQFLQVFLSSSFHIEIYGTFIVSTGSMLLFSGSLFAILMVYIREDALEARKIIYALVITNIVLAFLLIVFSWSLDGGKVNTAFNLPEQFYTTNAHVLFIGTLILLFDAFAIIFLYEFISKYLESLFFRMLFTMILVLAIDTLLFTLGIFWSSPKFQTLLFSGLITKSFAALIYSILFTFYMIYFDKENVKIESESDNFKDIFHKLTFRQKYEDVLNKIQLKTNELLEVQNIAQLGTFNLNFKTEIFTSSAIFDKIVGFDNSVEKTFSNWRTVVHPNDVSGNQEQLEISIATGKKFEREYRIITKNTKELKWLKGIGEIIYKDNMPFNFLGTIQDITERKRSEQALKEQNKELIVLSKKLSEKNKLILESQRKFKNLFDKSPVSLWEEDFSEVKLILNKKQTEVSDLKKYLDENPDFVNECVSKMKILNVNNVSLKLLGVKNRKELISHLSNNFNEQSYEVFKRELLSIASNAKEFSAQTEFIRSDGVTITTLIKFVIMDDTNNLAIISIVDINELNKAKQEITKSEKRFRELYEKSGDATLIIENGVFIECNQATVDMLAYKSKNDFLNTEPSKLSPLLQPDGQNSFEKAIKMISIALKKGTHRFEWIHTKSNGENFPVEVLLTAITKDPNDQIIHCVWRDISERIEIKAKLIKSEEKFSKAYYNNPSATYISSLYDGVFIDVNPMFEKISGFSREEVIGVKVTDLDIYVNVEDRTKLYNELKENGRLKDFEILFKTKKGEIKDCLMYSEIIDIDEKPCLISILRDVTENKLVESTLRQSEKELRESQEIAQLGTFNLDMLTNEFISSPIFDNIVGLNPNDSKEKEFWNVVTHPDDIDAYRIMLDDCVKNNKIFDKEYRIYNKSTNELKWLHNLGETLYSNGRPINFKGTIQDITERKLNELALKTNEKKLLEIQNIANLGTYEIDLKTNSITTSILYKSILNLKKKPKNNKGWWKNIVHPDDYKQSEFLWQDSIKNAIKYNDEYRIITDQNKIKWIHDIAEVKTENGVAVKVVGTIQDITSRKVSEEKIERSDAILSQLSSLVKVVNEKGDVIYASPSFKSCLGYEPEELLGQGWWIKTSPNLKSAIKIRDSVLNNVLKNDFLEDELKYRWIQTINGQPKLFQWAHSKGVDNTLIFVGIDITEREIAEKNSVQYWKIVENSLNEIFIFDADTLKFIQVNRGARENIGYSSKELLKMTPINLKPLIAKGKFNEMLKPLKNGAKERIIFTTEHQRKDGSNYTAEVNIQKSELKLRPVFIASIKDVTQQERNEHIKQVIFNITKKSSESISLGKLFNFIKAELGKLINTNNFFIALYNEKTDMISTPYMVDERDNKNTFPKGETLTGHVIDSKKALLTNEEFINYSGKKPKVIGIGPQSKCWLGVPLIVEKQAIGAIVVQSYTDENAYTQDDVVLLELIAANIGQVIKKIDDLDQINLLNKALIQSPHAVIVTNKKGIIEYTNPAFTDLSGYSEAEAMGKKPNILKSDEQSSEFYKKLWKTIAKGKTWDGEFVNRHKAGKRYLVEANISSVKNKKGEITHFIGVQEDITHKRKLERQFINAFVEAQEIEKQNFGEELHDGISQILSAEAMYIDLLIEQNKDRINDKAKFLTKIKELNVSAIYETRSIAHGLMSNQLKKSGLIKAIENICFDYSSTKNMQFFFTKKNVVEKEISKVIKINIFRIVQEITTNVVRHSLAKKVAIHLSKIDKNMLKLIVKDDGLGIDIEKNKKGTGLKNIERRIILLNGNLTIDTAPLKGTSFTIIVPLKSVQ